MDTSMYRVPWTGGWGWGWGKWNFSKTRMYEDHELWECQRMAIIIKWLIDATWLHIQIIPSGVSSSASLPTSSFSSSSSSSVSVECLVGGQEWVGEWVGGCYNYIVINNNIIILAVQMFIVGIRLVETCRVAGPPPCPPRPCPSPCILDLHSSHSILWIHSIARKIKFMNCFVCAWPEIYNNQKSGIREHARETN